MRARQFWVACAIAALGRALPAAADQTPETPPSQPPVRPGTWEPEPMPFPDQAGSMPFKETKPKPEWMGAPTPRLRIGIDVLLGGNSIYTPGTNGEGVSGTNGTGGIGVALRLGAQLSELLSVELDFGGLLGPLLETRGAVLVGFTPLEWLSMGVGPAVGYQSGTECPIICAPPVCPSYGGAYLAGVARIDFLPGVGAPLAVPRVRRSFDIGLVAMGGIPTAGTPQGQSPFGFGLYLVLGWLQF